jgi:hypothetical protein
MKKNKMIGSFDELINQMIDITKTQIILDKRQTQAEKDIKFLCDLFNEIKGFIKDNGKLIDDHILNPKI